jgi:hypothetical protein
MQVQTPPKKGGYVRPLTPGIFLNYKTNTFPVSLSSFLLSTMYFLHFLTFTVLHVALSCHVVRAIECNYQSEFPTADGSKCVQVACRNDAFCQTNYAKYCPKDVEMKCLRLNISKTGSAICSCRGQWSGDRYGNSGSCNRNLNGNSKCKGKGQVCSPSGKCIADPHCSFLGESCDTQGCCEGYCSGASGTGKTCRSTIPPGQPCTNNKAPCERGSVCSKGMCTLPVNGACKGSSIPCPPNSQCIETGYMGHVYEICACKNGQNGDFCGLSN